MPHINTTKDLKNERGQTMAELALVLPVLARPSARDRPVRRRLQQLRQPDRRSTRRCTRWRGLAELADPAGACRARVLASAGSLNTTELGRNLSCTSRAWDPGVGRHGARRLSLRHQLAQLECEERPFQLHDEGACGMSFAARTKRPSGCSHGDLAGRPDRDGGAGARRRHLDAHRPQASGRLRTLQLSQAHRSCPTDVAGAKALALRPMRTRTVETSSAPTSSSRRPTRRTTRSASGAAKTRVGNLQQDPRDQLGQHQGRREGARRTRRSRRATSPRWSSIAITR